MLGDILSFPELADSTIALMDIDEKRLQQSLQVAQHVNKVLGASATFISTTDRREALKDAQYVICMIQVVRTVRVMRFERVFDRPKRT